MYKVVLEFENKVIEFDNLSEAKKCAFNYQGYIIHNEVVIVDYSCF